MIEDADKLARKMKGEMPGREHEATRKGEELALKAGATIDREVRPYTVHMVVYPADVMMWIG